MVRVTIVVSVLCVVLVLPVDCRAEASTEFEASSQRGGFLPVVRESTVTRIGPVQQAYGVGTVGFVDMECFIADAPDSALFASGGIGAVSSVWVIWDLGSVPSGAEVLQVEIEHRLTPAFSTDPESHMQYGALSMIFLPPPECIEAAALIVNEPVYTEVEIGATSGTRRYVLGGTAPEDVESQLARRGMFSVGIRGVGDFYESACGYIPGWSAGGPDLLITWRDPSPVDQTSWGTVKALFRP